MGSFKANYHLKADSSKLSLLKKLGSTAFD